MKTVDQLIEDIITLEGKYTNDPSDSGGETMWGVTVATARRYGYFGPMVDMPRGVAKTIYIAKYFIAPGFDKVAVRSQDVAAELLDTGVNLGQATAVRFLQRALNVFNHGGTDYPDVTPSATVDAPTLVALDAYLKMRKHDGIIVMCRTLNALQGAYYVDLAERRPKDEKYTYGWFLNRVVI
jgi:lysozyme family protein